jgi:hypothetical protein
MYSYAIEENSKDEHEQQHLGTTNREAPFFSNFKLKKFCILNP